MNNKLPEITVEFNYKNHQDLLREVYKYYPVGVPAFKKIYEGYSILTALINSKFEQEESNYNKLYNKLALHLKKLMNELNLVNCFHYQFPNLFYTIILSEKNNENLCRRLSLNICIPLHLDNYTIFFEESFFLFHESVLKGSHVFYGYDSYKDDLNTEISRVVKSVIAEYYPGKIFISHYLLQNYFINGVVPFTESEEEYSQNPRPVSVYELLFHPFISPSFSVIH